MILGSLIGPERAPSRGQKRDRATRRSGIAWQSEPATAPAAEDAGHAPLSEGDSAGRVERCLDRSSVPLLHGGVLDGAFERSLHPRLLRRDSRWLHGPAWGTRSWRRP